MVTIFDDFIVRLGEHYSLLKIISGIMQNFQYLVRMGSWDLDLSKAHSHFKFIILIFAIFPIFTIFPILMQPHSDAVKLECTQDEMVVLVKKCLTPDATQVRFADESCKTEINESDQIYQVSTTLDACSTKAELKIVRHQYLNMTPFLGLTRLSTTNTVFN